MPFLLSGLTYIIFTSKRLCQLSETQSYNNAISEDLVLHTRHLYSAYSNQLRYIIQVNKE